MIPDANAYSHPIVLPAVSTITAFRTMSSTVGNSRYAASTSAMYAASDHVPSPASCRRGTPSPRCRPIQCRPDTTAARKRPLHRHARRAIVSRDAPVSSHAPETTTLGNVLSDASPSPFRDCSNLYL